MITLRQRLLRSDREEILDREGQSPRGQRILADLDRFNRLSGWYRRHVAAVWRHWRALGEPRPFRVLDIGTGQGGLLKAIAGDAAARGVPVELVGIERSPSYAAEARVRLGPGVHILEADATALPLPDGSFDLATCTLMLHHLPHAVRLGLVDEVGRVARSLYLFDLEVTVTGVLGWPVLALGTGAAWDTVHDGVVSVMRGHSVAELEALVAALPVHVERVFPTALCTMPGKRA